MGQELWHYGELNIIKRISIHGIRNKTMKITSEKAERGAFRKVLHKDNGIMIRVRKTFLKTSKKNTFDLCTFKNLHSKQILI